MSQLVLEPRQPAPLKAAVWPALPQQGLQHQPWYRSNKLTRVPMSACMLWGRRSGYQPRRSVQDVSFE